MAKLLVEVDDPLSRKPVNKANPPLMLGTMVRVEIAGRTLNNVIGLPEAAVHDGRMLWLMTDRETLDMIDIEPVWSEQRLVYLNAGQLPQHVRVVTSDLAAPVNGMRIRAQNVQLPQESAGARP